MNWIGIISINSVSGSIDSRSRVMDKQENIKE